MTLDTGAGPGVARPRSAERPAVLDPDATRALSLVTVDPFTGAARAVRSPVPAPPAALAQTGRVAPRPRVTAVLVSRDAEDRLARTLGAVAAQTRRPDLLVAADTGSTDRSRAMLATATPHVLALGRKASFPDAVQAAVAALVARTRVDDEPRRDPGAAPDKGVRVADHDDADQDDADQDDGVVPDVPRADDADAAARPAAGGRREGEGRGQTAVEWLWLLHDDCAPAPTALAELLEAVETAPSVAVAGCKQVGWDDDQHLLDVGFTTSPFGARVTGLDPREVDQGQHDGRSDVLAVSTAGMLVRRDVWQALGGPDPLLAHARDDVDLCRRVRLAGHRVVVVPSAVVAHAGSGASGEPAVPGWYRADRRDTLHLRLAAARPGLVPLVWLWTALAAPVRALWRLVLKQPDRAVDELVAAALVVVRPRRWLRSRARARRGRTVPRDTLRPLLAPRRTLVRRHRDALAAWAASALAVETPRRPVVAGPVEAAEPGGWARRRMAALVAVRPAAPAVSGAPTLRPGGLRGGTDALDLDATDAAAADGTDVTDVVPDPAGAPADRAGDAAGKPGELPPAADRDPEGPDATTAPDAATASASDTAGPAASRPGGRRGLAGVAVLVVAAATAGALALRHVVTGTGALVGPSALPAPERLADLWRLARSGWRPAGLGRAGVADPFDTVLAGLSVLAGGSPRAAVLGLVVLGLPLAALTGWWAAGAVTRSRAARLWAGAVWAAAPALLGAVGAARPASVLAHVVLPLAAVAVGRAVTRRSVAAAAAAGLALAVVLAAAPSLAVPAVVALLATLAVRPRRAALLGVTVVLPAALLLPWWAAVARAPRLLLADPQAASAGSSAASSGAAPSPLWHLLLLPGAPDAHAATLHRLTEALARVPGLAPVTARLDAVDPALLVAGCAAVLAAPVALLAVAGLLRRRWPLALVAGVAAASGLAVAVAAGRVQVAGTPSGPVTGWSGPGVSLLTLGLLVAALAGADGVLAAARSRAGRGTLWSLRGLAAAGAVLAVAGPLAVVAVWAAQPVAARRLPADVLPALAAQETRGAAGMRTLVLDVRAGRVRWSLLGAPGPVAGDTSAAAAERALARSTGRAAAAGVPDAGLVVPAVGALLSDSGRDVRADLARLAVGSVLVLDPVPDRAVLALDASPGLARVATSARGDLLWRVQLDTTAGGPSRPSRVRVVDGAGATLAAVASSGPQVATTLPAGPAGRRLVLAERRDAGWQATVDGRSLAATTVDGWAQGFVLPERGGRLVVRHTAGLDGPSGLPRLALLVLAVLVALPLPTLRRRVVAEPPRPSRPVPRGMVAPAAVAPMPQVFDADNPAAPQDAEPDETAWPMTPVPRRRLFGRRRDGEARDGDGEARDGDGDDADRDDADREDADRDDDAGPGADDAAGPTPETLEAR